MKFFLNIIFLINFNLGFVVMLDLEVILIFIFCIFRKLKILLNFDLKFVFEKSCLYFNMRIL